MTKEYKLIREWLMKEPDVELIKPYANEVRGDMSPDEVADLRKKFAYKKGKGHTEYLVWAFLDAAKEVGFDAREV